MARGEVISSTLYKPNNTHLIETMPMKPLKQIFMLALGLALAGVAQAQSAKKPNILIIWGDDVGMYNISAYHRGLMGGSTPNIDRLAKEGMLFMDHYRPDDSVLNGSYKLPDAVPAKN